MSLIVDIEKKLGSFLLKIRFETENEIFSLLGASGSGKSMTLKCIAGIEKPDRGHIELNGRVLFDSDKKIDLPPQKRRVGYLFQQYALFPNMTVWENIACGAKRNSKSKVDIQEIIRSMHLDGLENRLPAQLSGGQQQRTALARILMNEPDVLLLDEPFSALDSHFRFRLERELYALMRSFGKPVLLVSHDRDEVYRLSDRIAVIEKGHIDAIGGCDEVFSNPNTLAGAVLTGCKNVIEATSIDEQHINVPGWGMILEVPSSRPDVNYVGIRLHDICLGNGVNSFLCKVEEEIENPFSYTLMLRYNESQRTFGMDISKEKWAECRSDMLQIHFPPEKILLLKKNA